MDKFFVIGGCILLCLTYIQLSKAAQCYNSYCPPAPSMSEGEMYCRPFVDMYFALQGACMDVFGDALTLTDTGKNVTAQDNDPNNVCPYFGEGTYVDDCLYPNGTVEIYICTSLFTLAYLFKDICSDYYTLADNSSYTPLGQLQYQYSLNPCANCRPAPGPQFCQLVPNPNPPSECPNCASSSVAPTSSSMVMPSSMSMCQ